MINSEILPEFVRVASGAPARAVHARTACREQDHANLIAWKTASMVKSKDYQWLMKRAKSHRFADKRLVENYGHCIRVILEETRDSTDIVLNADLTEVVRLATGLIFEDNDVPAFDDIDIDAVYQRIRCSPDFLGETITIVSESFRTYLFRFIYGDGTRKDA